MNQQEIIDTLKAHQTELFEAARQKTVEEVSRKVIEWLQASHSESSHTFRPAYRSRIEEAVSEAIRKQVGYSTKEISDRINRAFESSLASSFGELAERMARNLFAKEREEY